MTIRRRPSLATAAAAAVVLAAGCAPSPVPLVESRTSFACMDPATADGLVPFSVGNDGGLTTAPYVEWGLQNGCFAKHGLDVTTVANSAANTEKLASLVGGSLDVASDTPTEIIIALANSGIELQVVAGGYEFTPEQLAKARAGELSDGSLVLETVIIASAATGFQELGDFAGSRVGVPPGRGLLRLALERLLVGEGISLEKVEFVTLDAAERMAAFERGDLEFIQLTGAMAYQALDSGGRIALYPGAFIYEPGAVTAWYTTEEIARTKTAEIEAFQSAIREIHQLLIDPVRLESFRTFLADYFDVPSSVVGRFQMPRLITRPVERAEMIYIVDILKESTDIPSDFRLPDDIVF